MRKKYGFRAACAVLVALILLVLVDIKIRPVIKTVAANRVRIVATETINSAILTELSANGTSYSSLVTILKDSEGKASAVETDTIAVNTLSAKISAGTNKKLSELQKLELSIPSGTLSGVQLLAGRGAAVKLKIVPSGYIKTQMISEFSAAGINQSLHKLYIKISAEMSAILPGYSSAVETDVTYIIAETVIVGAVPGYFTQVLSESSNIAGTLKDYGNPTSSQ